MLTTLKATVRRNIEQYGRIPSGEVEAAEAEPDDGVQYGMRAPQGAGVAEGK